MIDVLFLEKRIGKQAKSARFVALLLYDTAQAAIRAEGKYQY